MALCKTAGRLAGCSLALLMASTGWADEPASFNDDAASPQQLSAKGPTIRETERPRDVKIDAVIFSEPTEKKKKKKNTSGTRGFYQAGALALVAGEPLIGVHLAGDAVLFPHKMRRFLPLIGVSSRTAYSTLAFGDVGLLADVTATAGMAVDFDKVMIEAELGAGGLLNEYDYLTPLTFAARADLQGHIFLSDNAGLSLGLGVQAVPWTSFSVNVGYSGRIRGKR